MAKSPLVVGAIGLAGCLALSVIMRSALEVQQRQQRDPLESELEERFGTRLAGPVRIADNSVDGRLRVRVELTVVAGLRHDRLIEAAGRLVWERRQGRDNEPAEVQVVVTDDGEGRSVSELVPRPRFRSGAVPEAPRTESESGSPPARPPRRD